MKRVLLLPWSLPDSQGKQMCAFARQMPRYLSLRLGEAGAADAVFAPFCLESEEGPQLVISGQTQKVEELCEIGEQYEAQYVVGGLLTMGEDEARVGLQVVDVRSGRETIRTVIGSLAECRAFFTVLMQELLAEIEPQGTPQALGCEDLSPHWEANAAFFTALDRMLAAELGEVASPQAMFEDFFAAVERDPAWEEGAEQLIGAALDVGLEDQLSCGVQALERLTAVRPLMHKAWEALGWLYHADGRVQDVIRVMEQARALAPAEFHSHHRLSAAYRQSQRFAEAEMQLRLGLAGDPDNIPLLNELGVVLDEMGRHLESAECFARLVELSPISGAFHANLAVTLQRLGRLAEAEAAFQDGMRALDPHWNVYVNYAELLEEAGRPLDWVQVLFAGIRALNDRPDEQTDLATRLVAGVHKWISGKQCPPEVEQKGRGWLIGLLESLLETLPEHQSSSVVLSELYRLDGRQEQAIQCLERVAERDPDNVYLHIHINTLKAGRE
ncbi:tetratricopeptide repeat protein [Tumebacillus flagellatus]|uniref:Tetratricopeptide repeat protein n=1 Tax=Tumebacillus flagellatus TaxID=1157490 RepID=A0A074LT04_9BACL|nr:tetratricopeptide repeat protein [Tumebacillus flagellatus]KEO83605.1 hypothetical protein EL26_09340 [Tumebacillus flagellatus]